MKDKEDLCVLWSLYMTHLRSLYVGSQRSLYMTDVPASIMCDESFT